MSRKNFQNFSRDDVLNEIMKKKEFSHLPREDVSLVYSQFEKREVIVEDKIKLARDLLRKMYTAFVSDKLLSVKDKDAEWFLRKHISTSERLGYYKELYGRCLKKDGGWESETKKWINVFDFGCGINGFSYDYFDKAGFNVNYIGTEPVGQLVDLQNSWFDKRRYLAGIEHLSLFDLAINEKLVKSVKGNKIAFFFKVLDSLEMIKRDYSKEVLTTITPLVNRVVISWATKSLVSKKTFHAKRKWLKNFIEENFKIIDEFDMGVEHYLVFQKKN